MEAVYVFGSYANGLARPDSDIDLLFVCADSPGDLFEFTYEIRRFLHEQIEMAIDVVVTTTEQFKQRQHQRWTVEHVAHSEGIAV
ncbi:MAG: nucleotidyltransferase domain-containing protein [Spirochaetaceae bacterium]|nr:nucleotidyltransferase domain-containing protein [Spirochaetaceae bacterium]MDT8297744.1 nucleotidyltransferase domain-containing protein [Spirochaetaceae bacterium]